MRVKKKYVITVDVSFDPECDVIGYAEFKKALLAAVRKVAKDETSVSEIGITEVRKSEGR